MDWQPIDTAPKDGTPILIAVDYDEWPCAVVKWDDTPYFDEQYGWKDDDEVRFTPTFWMPLPLAPLSKAESDELDRKIAEFCSKP